MLRASTEPLIGISGEVTTIGGYSVNTAASTEPLIGISGEAVNRLAALKRYQSLQRSR